MKKKKLIIENVTKQFVTPKGEKVIALQNISGYVEKSEFVTIVGTSGCGNLPFSKLWLGLNGRRQEKFSWMAGKRATREQTEAWFSSLTRFTRGLQ